MDYQILALDLDGTLTNSKKEISAPTLEALIEIQQKGKKVVLASGRPTQGVLPLARQLHLEEYGGYVLSFNGGRIIDCRTGQAVYNRSLPSGVAEPLTRIIGNYPRLDILAYLERNLLSAFCPNQYSQLESFINHMPIIQADDFTAQIPDQPNKFLVTGEPDLIQAAKKEVTEYFRSYLSIYCSDPFFLEIMPPRIDKAHSLLRLLTSIGLTADQMICCGDGYNDLTMIETAGLGVAMANAQPLVKERADYVTRSNDEDGVLHVIQQFMQ